MGGLTQHCEANNEEVVQQLMSAAGQIRPCTLCESITVIVYGLQWSTELGWLVLPCKCQGLTSARAAAALREAFFMSALLSFCLFFLL